MWNSFSHSFGGTIAVCWCMSSRRTTSELISEEDTSYIAEELNYRKFRTNVWVSLTCTSKSVSISDDPRIETHMSEYDRFASIILMKHLTQKILRSIFHIETEITFNYSMWIWWASMITYSPHHHPTEGWKSVSFRLISFFFPCPHGHCLTLIFSSAHLLNRKYSKLN